MNFIKEVLSIVTEYYGLIGILISIVGLVIMLGVSRTFADPRFKIVKSDKVMLIVSACAFVGGVALAVVQYSLFKG